MIVETDLKKIKKVTERKRDENWEFRSFLKGYDIEIGELRLEEAGAARMLRELLKSQRLG